MKARQVGYCNLCATAIEPQEEIEKFLGQWAHAACKAAEIARRTASGRRVEIPAQKGWPAVPRAGSKARNRRELRELKRRKG